MKSLILKLLIFYECLTFSSPSISLTASVAHPIATTAWSQKTFHSAYLAASWLTDPACKSYELYRRTMIVDVLHPTASRVEKIVRKFALLIGSVTCGCLSLMTTLSGMGLRFVANSLQSQPFFYEQGDAEEKTISQNRFSLLSWNLCGPSAGFSITDGGVLPSSFRINKLVSELRNQDADIVSLYEIFDIQTALQLKEGLKDRYAHFYFHIGPRTLGLPSGLFIASKIKVGNPHFDLFPEEAKDGRGTHANKGCMSFDLMHDETPVARIFSTHLQHSEIPSNPTDYECRARDQEMQIILDKIERVADRVVILTGDLNLEDREYNASSWHSRFTKGVIRSSGFTWGGDHFSSSLSKKPSSSALNLDHTMLVNHPTATIETTYVETGFDASRFNPEALSDHKGLLTIVRFSNNS